jgi:hypothetical protein
MKDSVKIKLLKQAMKFELDLSIKEKLKQMVRYEKREQLRKANRKWEIGKKN